MNLFITGTDTGVGKTYVTSLLLKALRIRGIDAVGVKPIETGDGDDARQLHAAAEYSLPFEVVNPIRFHLPAAPAVAAEHEGRAVVLTDLIAAYHRAATTHSVVLVEGAGGWRVPISPDYDMARLAADLSDAAPLRVLVVARNRLGVINHTRLTLESICASGLICVGFVLNEGPESIFDGSLASNVKWIGTSAPCLFEITKGQTSLDLSRQLCSFLLSGNA